MLDYVELVGTFYPDVGCYSPGAPDDYSAIVWSSSPIPQAELDVVYLTKYKTDKIIMFSEMARQDIEGGFKSSALGFPHWYDAQPEDQMNLIGSVATGSDMPYSCRPYTRTYQEIDCGGVITSGTRATGLPNTTQTFNAEVVVDGVSSYVSIIGNEAQTYDQLVTQINADLALNSNAFMAIESGNLRVYGDDYGSQYTVEFIDSSLGPNLSDFVAVLPAVPGIDGKNSPLKEYKLHTHATLMQIINDGKDVKLFILQKFAVKKEQITYATSTDAVDAIVW